MITNSNLSQAPPRDRNDARNLILVILPTVLGILCLLGFVFLEVKVSRVFLSHHETFWSQVVHGSHSEILAPGNPDLR